MRLSRSWDNLQIGTFLFFRRSSQLSLTWSIAGRDIHDYVIYAAGQYGLRVILPLTDDYDL